MKSPMIHQFSMAPSVQVPRSVFNRSHAHKTAFDAAKLIPIYVDEVLPGDTFNMRATIMCRLSTPIVPLMDNLWVETFWFFVPNRLVWDNWKYFMGEKVNPSDTTEYVMPMVYTGELSSWAEESLADYFGIPPGVEDLKVNALPFRAYNLIYNEWFRAQDFINSAAVPTDDGDDSMAIYTIRRRGKRHDYFTSMLPLPQRGAGVELPLGTTAPVIGTDYAMRFSDNSGSNYVGFVGTNDGNRVLEMAAETTWPVLKGADYTPDTGAGVYKAIGLRGGTGIETGLVADLAQATAATINSLRQAFQLQRMLERDARSGTRYTEVIRAHFGVVSPDMRQMRPEILGMSSARMGIHPVQQTSSTDVQSPQGNLAAYGVMSDVCGFSKSFTEHGIVMGLINVRADLTYQQGLNRMWFRETRYDHYWPALAHLGEQEVFRKELYLPGVADDDVMGYQERYAEYRYHPSKITGKMRSISATSLDVWHCSEYFDSEPQLNQNFIEDQTDIILERNLAVGDEPNIIMDSYFDLKCARPMPVFAIPGLIDHF